MSASLADFRYGFRQLRLNPGFTAIAVVTLALGIGANTALFSVVRHVLWKPLPYREPERIHGAYAEAGLFDVLGAKPAQGRLFTKEEETQGKNNVAVIGWGLWQ